MSRELLGLLFFVVLLTGCENSMETDEDDTAQTNALECQVFEDAYTLKGNVVFDGYVSGPIELFFVEDVSTECGADDGTLTSRTPGELLGTVVLDAPGPFEVSLTHHRISIPDAVWNGPSVVYIIATNKSNTDSPECQGAAVTYVPQMTQSNIQLTLLPQPCPGLM